MAWTFVSPLPSVSAEAVGSPASLLKKGKWAMGVNVGFLPEMKMKGNAKVTVYQVGHFRGYGLTDRLSVFGKLGGAYLEADDPSVVTSDALATHRFGASFMVGLGLKGKIWESADTGWEWDGLFNFLDLRARHRGRNDAHWREWTLGTSVAKSMGRAKPYVGLKYSLTDMKFKVRQNGNLLQQGIYKPQHRVGMFVGTDVYLGEFEDWVLNVETNYLDGAEFDVALQYTF